MQIISWVGRIFDVDCGSWDTCLQSLVFFNSTNSQIYFEVFFFWSRFLLFDDQQFIENEFGWVLKQRTLSEMLNEIFCRLRCCWIFIRMQERWARRENENPMRRRDRKLFEFLSSFELLASLKSRCPRRRNVKFPLTDETWIDLHVDMFAFFAPVIIHICVILIDPV